MVPRADEDWRMAGMVSQRVEWYKAIVIGTASMIDYRAVNVNKRTPVSNFLGAARRLDNALCNSQVEMNII